MMYRGYTFKCFPPPALLTYLCPGRPCFSSSDVFLFCWAAFLSISLLASVFPVSLPLFFLFLRPCLIHARMPDWGRAFVHGHTFLHSWTHFLAFMDTLSCIHGHTFLHSWTHFLAFMDTLSCIHGHTFLHSWTHFLAFMDTLSCIHGHTFLHSWSGPMTLVVGLLHGATFLSNLPLVLFVSFIGP